MTFKHLILQLIKKGIWIGTYISLHWSGQVFAQEESIPNSCAGSLINGVCWAKYNVGEPGRFTNFANPYGMLYQWNRKKGWPTTEPNKATWNNNPESKDYWDANNNPCPTGWRIPTPEELNKLVDLKVVEIEYTPIGRRYVDKFTNDTIYLPYAGYIKPNGDYYDSPNINSYTVFYWSNSSHHALNAGNLPVSTTTYIDPAYGLSIRCVADTTACDITLSMSEHICQKELPYKWRDTTFQKGTKTGEYCLRRTRKESGCDSIVYLYLEVNEFCKQTCPGVLFDSICWARSNVDKPGRFASTPEAYGMYYQWNRRKGWSGEKPGFEWNDNPYTAERWERENDPCPVGWRVPTPDEMRIILNFSKVDYIETQLNGINGTTFIHKSTGNSLFFPHGGHLSANNSAHEFKKYGSYWTNSPVPSIVDPIFSLNKENFAYSLRFFVGPWLEPFVTTLGASVRCVTDGDITNCDGIITDTSKTIFTHSLPHVWGDTIFDVGTESGVYRFQYISATTGCDSIVNLHLTIQHPFDTTFYDTVCQGSPYDKHGFSYFDVQKDKIDSLLLPSPSGCDSTFYLHLKVYPVYDTTFHDTICQGEPYYRHGFELPHVAADTSIHLSMQSVYGCDSTATLHLTVHPSYHFPDSADICEGDSIPFGGRWLHTSGTYYDTLATIHGCDSVHSMKLTVHPSPHRYFESAVCYGKSYDRNGFYLPAVYADTVVQDTFKTPWGCDSIRTLMLTVNPVYDTPLYDTVCRGKDYYEHGFNLPNVQTDGFHSLTVPSRAGCDSVLSLHLTVLPVYDTLLYDSICPTARYDRHSFQLTGVTKDTISHLSLQTVRGCDSLVTLNLHVYPAYFFPAAEEICRGDSTPFQGKWVSEAKIHYDSLKTIHGCDSIYLLDLTVLPTYDTLLFDVLCEGTPYTGYGFNVSEAGKHRRRLQTRAGCDSLVTLVLTEEKRIEGGIGLSLEDCTVHGYTFFFEPEVSQASWEWDMGDGSTLRAEEGEGYHTYADSGDYRIRLRIETYNGCENRFTHVQHVPPYLADVPILADRTVIDEEEPTVRFRAEALPGMVCRWDFGDGTTGEGESISHTYDATTARFYDVGLQVLNADSCVTESRIRIEVLFLPKDINTFSPNGDGINDVFMQGFRIEIINRNGVRIFTGENGWDGSYQGKPATEDTYFYKLYYRTARGERMKTGFVTLIR